MKRIFYSIVAALLIRREGCYVAVGKATQVGKPLPLPASSQVSSSRGETVQTHQLYNMLNTNSFQLGTKYSFVWN